MKKIILLSFVAIILLFSASMQAQFKTVVSAPMDSASLLSSTFDLAGRVPVAFYVPSNFRGSKLFLWFSETPDSASFKQYNYAGSTYEVAVVKNRWLGVLHSGTYPALRYMKVTSDSTQNTSGIIIKTITGGL